jgi:hypothetical protein
MLEKEDEVGSCRNKMAEAPYKKQNKNTKQICIIKLGKTKLFEYKVSKIKI